MREAKFLKCVINLFGLEVAFLLVTLACNHHGHKSGLNVLLLVVGIITFVFEFNTYSINLAVSFTVNHCWAYY